MADAHLVIDELQKELAKPQEPTALNPLTHEELINLDIPPMQWIMNMVIPYPGLIVLSGKPGSYKTFFALWIALRASAGLPLFEPDECEEPFFCSITTERPMGKIPTLMIEEENSKQLMKERARSFQPVEIGELCYLINHGFKFTDPQMREQLKQIIAERCIKLLILDPFSSVMGLEDENSNSEASKVMDIVRKEFVDHDMTVILIHHPSKGDGSGKNIRGAGDILGKCDVHLCMEVDENALENEIRVSYEKLRVADRRTVNNFRVRLTGDDLFRNKRFRYLGIAKSKVEKEREDLSAQILEALQDGEEREQKEIAELVNQRASNSKFKAAWKALTQQKLILRNAITKRFHIDQSVPKNVPF